jgi:beta-glucosidase
LVEGLKNVGYTVDDAVKGQYEKYLEEVKAAKAKEEEKDPAAKRLAAFMPPVLPTEFVPAKADIAAAVASNDVAIITLGRISGEFADRTTANFNLSKEEKSLIDAVSGAFHAAGKKVVVVLNIGGVIETASWKNTPDAVLLAWQAGQEGGNSVADVLSGKVSPSGKLPQTWPIKLEDHASTKNFPRGEDWGLDLSAFMGGAIETEAKALKEFWDYSNHEEGIYVGYRWFDKQNMNVSYPFGYGLSYTTFEYSDAAVKAEGDKISVSVTVKNTGKAEGKEVVQVYASAPASQLDKPVKELKAFAKTKSLKPGESETLTMVVNAADLASFVEESNSWEVEAGTYKFLIGASSRDIKATVETEVAAKSTKVNQALKAQEFIKK